MANQIIFTDLLLDRLALLVRPTTRFFGFEGPARSAKTGLVIQGFYFRMYSSDDMVGCIAGRNLDSILNNILKEPTIGLLTTHPELKMVKDKVGSYYIEMPTPKGIKKILLAGYSDSSRWKNILGGNIAIFLIDEANIADDTFIKETFARQLACANPLTIFTTNGDNPDHFIYQEFMNYGKIIGQTPATTRALIEQFQAAKGKKDGYYYSHFKMSDNPVMTPDKLERAQSIYPVGSYYYKTKILGERGVQGSLIYNEYMNEDLIIDAYAKDNYGNPIYKFRRYTIGIDIGETKAHNVFVLLGWIGNYDMCVILNYDSFVRVGYNIKKERLRNFIQLIKAEGVPLNLCDGIAVDSAEQNFIEDLKVPYKREFNLDVFGSWKATIKERVDMNIVGFSAKRVRFHYKCKKVYDAFYSSTWVEGKEGEERLDSNIEANDLMDGTEYGQTRHMKQLMRAGD